MGKPVIYIDGQSGTTGLQIRERLAKREDLELAIIPEEKRHDNEEHCHYSAGITVEKHHVNRC